MAADDTQKEIKKNNIINMKRKMKAAIIISTGLGIMPFIDQLTTKIVDYLLQRLTLTGFSTGQTQSTSLDMKERV